MDEAAAKRIADAQRMMHQATQAKADLQKTLNSILGHPVLGPQAQQIVSGVTPVPPAAPAPVPVAPPAPPVVAQPPAPPAPIQAPPTTTLEPSPEFVREVWTKYSDQNLKEEDAFALMFREMYRDLGQKVVNAVRQDPGLREQTYGEVVRRAVENAKNAKAYQAVEGFWKQAAPGVNPRVIWKYAEDVQREHPNAPLSDQAYYCLERALNDIAPLVQSAASAQAVNSAISRGQEAGLPGTGAPPQGAAGEGTPTMAEQMRAMRARFTGLA